LCTSGSDAAFCNSVKEVYTAFMPMDAIKRLQADFLEELEIGMGRSAKTVENYDRYLTKFFARQQITAPADITMQAVREFRRWLNESAGATGGTPMAPSSPEGRYAQTASFLGEQAGVSLATQNYHFIALRQFLKYLARRDIAALPADKVLLAKLGDRDIDVLYPEEADSLLAAADLQTSDLDMENDLPRLRDKAILEVLYSTGVRVSELIRLDRDDIRKNSNEVAVRGKGNKVRVVFLSESALGAVRPYVTARGDIDPALFVRHGPNAADARNLRLTPRSVQRMIKKYAALAGLTKQVTPHTLRHSHATDLLANGADVRQVQALLGHSSITTTQVYTHLTDVQLKDVHEKFHRKRRSG